MSESNKSYNSLHVVSKENGLTLSVNGQVSFIEHF